MDSTGSVIEDSASKKIDSVFVSIYNEEYKQIRKIRLKADTGLQRQFWGFEMKGLRMPGSAKPKPGGEEPGGRLVFPGYYTLVLNYAGETDSIKLLVKPDPLLQPSRAVYDAQTAALEKLQKSIDRVVTITDRLTEAEETISRVEASLKHLETPEADSLRKQGKVMSDSLKQLRHFVMGKPQEKQGYGSPYQLTVNGQLMSTRRQILGKEKKPDEEEYNQIAMGELLTEQAVERVNRFFEKDWSHYRKQVDSMDFSLFKTMGPIE